MKKFEIEVTETLQKVVSIKSESIQKACEVVKLKYNQAELVLEDSDFVDKDIKPYLYSTRYNEFYNCDKFKEFIALKAVNKLNKMPVEELVKLAFGDVERAILAFSK